MSACVRCGVNGSARPSWHSFAPGSECGACGDRSVCSVCESGPGCECVIVGERCGECYGSGVFIAGTGFGLATGVRCLMCGGTGWRAARTV